LGRLAHMPRTAADLALRFGAPVVVGTIHRKGPRASDGHLLEVLEIPFAADPPDREAEVTRLTAVCSAALEAAIRRHPAEWVWMHERWKTRPGHEAGMGDSTASATQANPMPKTADLSSG
jgi:Kdo2-lipid IVA lauroyltransferase/acyltransferase